VKRFRGGLVFKAHRLLYHSTLGLGVIKKKNLGREGVEDVLDVEVYERGHVLAVWADLGSSQFKNNYFTEM